MKIDTNLADVFDVESKVVTDVVAVEPEQTVNIDSDYEFTRKNIRSLLESGKTALEGALAVASSSEEPRAFEVVGTLMKQLAEINQQLMQLHQQKKKLDTPIGKELPPPSGVTNNAIFVGSTAEIIKTLSGMNKQLT